MVPIMNVLTDKSTLKRIRNGIIERMDKKKLHTIKEVAGNFLHNNISMTPKDLAHLSKYKNQIRRFAKDAKSLEERRKLLKQNGGFPRPTCSNPWEDFVFSCTKVDWSHHWLAL